MIKIKDKKLNRIQMIIGIISFPIGILITIFLFYNPSHTEKNIDKNLYGIWHSKYSFKISEGEYSIEGTTEYLKNNSYNFVGQVIVDIMFNHETSSATFYIDGAGKWTSDSSSFLTTMTDMKSIPVSVKYNDENIDIALFERVTGKEFPNLDESMPIGTSEEFKVIKINKNEIIAEVDDLQGEPIQFKMSRRDKRFQR